MPQSITAFNFVETADIGTSNQLNATLENNESLELDKIPDGVVSGQTLIDFTNAPKVEVRSAVSLALLFASRAATAGMSEGDDDDDWLALYTTNLGRLGFHVPPSTMSLSKFKKEGLEVHKAIIPFLKIALGGAAMGPIILSALENLKDIDKDRPWIKLFERERREFTTRELHFAAVSADVFTTTIRHVVARLEFHSRRTNILFFKIGKTEAEFESSSTLITANNSLLESLAPKLEARMAAEIDGFLAEVKTTA